MRDPLTVHLVGNAHIDPVWLWKYSAGVNEAVSTCYSAAGLLDRYQDFIFTRADSWVYEQIERLDPALFDRIGAYVREGRWDAAGGWYLQPDCNLPSEESFAAHMRTGKRYFRRAFGTDVKTAMNVDSFGHTAFLPRFLADHGFDSYVFMRPGKHERELPSELFRWQSPDGDEILTWRIQRSYNADSPETLMGNIEASLSAAVDGIPHVMCFYGVGNHGGGPTAELIEWIRSSRNSIAGAVLEFSSPSRFFDALRLYPERIGDLPVVTGELQYHAVGCYSVLNRFKQRLRRAELAAAEASSLAETVEQEDLIWKPVLLNQFHDTAGGTCIPDAYDDAEDQLGLAVSTAESIIEKEHYRHLTSLPPAEHQRIVLFNPGAVEFQGPVSHEPWRQWKAFSGTLRNSGETAVPYQLSQQPALFGEKRLMTWIARIPPKGTAVYTLDPEPPPETAETPTSGGGEHNGALKGNTWNVEPDAESICRLGSSAYSGTLDLLVLDDPSDTWSHNIGSYEGPLKGRFRVRKSEIEQRGPVFSSARYELVYGSSSGVMRVSEFRDYRLLRIELRMTWNEELSVAKLCFTLPDGYSLREDAVPGGWLQRPVDGREYPIAGGLSIGDAKGNGISIFSRELFACDVRPGMIRMTALRSPPFAWHYPMELQVGYPYRFTDRGEHRFTLLIDAGGHNGAGSSASRIAPGTTRSTTRDATPAAARDAQLKMQPPHIYDWTRGMTYEKPSF